MTKAAWNKLTDSQKLDNIDEKLRHIEVMEAIKVTVVLLGVFGLLTLVEMRAQNLLKKVKG